MCKNNTIDLIDFIVKWLGKYSVNILNFENIYVSTGFLLNYSMSFFALKYLRKYKTCHVANPSKQHILKMLKNSTLLLVFSVINE